MISISGMRFVFRQSFCSHYKSSAKFTSGSSTLPNNLNLPHLQYTSSTWKRKDIQEKMRYYILSSDDISSIEKEAEIMLPKILSKQKATWKFNEKDFPFSEDLQRKLRQIREDLISGHGFALLRGLPIERYSEEELATIYLGLGTHVGNARSQNRMGHILGHVLDLNLDSSDPKVRIYQTNERQTFHTDSADVVALLCKMKAKKGGLSMLVSANAVYNEMYEMFPDLLPYLLKPIATDRRGEVPMGEQPFLLIPVFSYYKNKLTPFYQRQYIESSQRFKDAPRLTVQHIQALDAFDNICNDPDMHLPMELEVGDMQFVHNHSLLHDRTTFEDDADIEKRRHLLRLWLSIPGDRELPKIFATRFGTTNVGDRGGIVVDGTVPCIPWKKDILHA